MKTGLSIIIPTYNRGSLLKRCIDSVIQTISPQDEVIIVDDGSKDTVEPMVNDYNDPRLIYIRQNNLGVSAARNTGLERAKNYLVAFIDDDDEWHPRKIDIQRELLLNLPDAVGCFSNFSITDKHGNKEPNYVFKWGQPICDWNELLGKSRDFLLEKTGQQFTYYYGNHYRNQMLDDYVLPSTLVVNRKNFKEKLQFRVGMDRNESWLFSSQVCRQGPVIYVDFDLACQHGDADYRLTAIPEVDTVISRLYVLEHEFEKHLEDMAISPQDYEQRKAREVKNLYLSSLRSKPERRKQLFEEYAYRNSNFQLANRMPQPLLSILSLGISVTSLMMRILRRLRLA